jgi:hypothetical protein
VKLRLVLCASTAGVVLAVLAGPASAQARCEAAPGSGTRGADVWRGTDASDVYFALAGDDSLDGAGGDDCLYDGPGADTVVGGAGADLLIGDDGRDRFAGGDGDDAIHAPDLLRDEVDCGAGAADFAEVDELDTVVGCERVVRLVYIHALLDLRWRATRRGVVIERAVVLGLTPEAEVSVTLFRRCCVQMPWRDVRTGGRRRARMRQVEGRRLARGDSMLVEVRHRTQPSFMKHFELSVRDYRNPRRVTQPFKGRSYCKSAPDQDLLSTPRCRRIGRVRR